MAASASSPGGRKKKQIIQQVRVLKVHGFYRVSHQETKVIPYIRLNGQWLERLGFEPGMQVTITTREKLLIIQLDEPLVNAFNNTL